MFRNVHLDIICITYVTISCGVMQHFSGYSCCDNKFLLKFCKEYLFLQNPKNALFTLGSYHSMKCAIRTGTDGGRQTDRVSYK